MDTMKDTTMQHVTDVTIAELKRAAEHPAKAPVIVRADTMLGVLARIEQLESDLATAEQDSRQKQARIERLEEEESKQAALLDCLNEWKAMAKSAEKERDALRARIEAMENQEPVGVLHVGNYYGEELQDWEFEANQCACDKLNEGYVSNPTSLPLYALPGAKGEEK